MRHRNLDTNTLLLLSGIRGAQINPDYYTDAEWDEIQSIANKMALRREVRNRKNFNEQIKYFRKVSWDE